MGVTLKYDLSQLEDKTAKTTDKWALKLRLA